MPRDRSTPTADTQLIVIEAGPSDECLAFPVPATLQDHQPITHEGERVLTTDMAATAFAVDPGRIANNYDRNRNRFEEGKHYFRITGAALRELKHDTSLRGLVAPQASQLMLWTERGIARHAKMLETDTAWKVFEELEDSYFAVRDTAASAPALPNFSDPVAAARAWADEREARTLAEVRKAEIGSRREASSMATASAAVRRARKLEAELDRSCQYATVKRMEIAFGRKFSFAPVRKASKAMDLVILDVPDPNFGSVKSYHALAWREAYGVDVPGWTGAEGDA